ncbi:kinase-like protein [Tothia fuscella]|uniref:Kinase-like protein n=1 Tax=Tothia fuscella TaxID=1048955 RepID=A0A9P4TXT3_9PEZI|nr:kinase-like protein [Tothia fuscella]
MSILQSQRREPQTVQTIQSTSEDNLFSYKAQRWLWNEHEQLQRRYVRFDVAALIRVVEDALGPDASCVEFTKLPEGNFNKTFIATMQDGRELIARLPNPNAGRPHYTTASEVATMAYVRDRLQIPAPKVLTYSTQSSTNGIGAEYIIMEKCPGIELGRVWDELAGKEKIEIVKQLATFTARLSNARFPYYGSLYYTRDIHDVKAMQVDDIFSVGPTTSRTWFDDKRGEVDIYHGPWQTAEEVMEAMLKREVACIETFSKFPKDRQQGIFNGPGGYCPSKTAKLAVIEDVRRVLPYILPRDDAYTASVLWHNDLHSDNIFVDKERPTQITGIIDWQGVPLNPAFLHVHYPSLIEYQGPILDGFEKPQLPTGYEELDKDAKKTARALHTAQSIWMMYKVYTRKQAPDQLRLLSNRDFLPWQILGLIGSAFDDGEAYVQKTLSALAEPEIWRKILSQNDQEVVQCPLVYSAEQLSKQQIELAKWERDVERKARVLKEVGVYTGWDGAVLPDEYDIVSERLERAREKFLDIESESSAEREQWAKVWPFRDV